MRTGAKIWLWGGTLCWLVAIWGGCSRAPQQAPQPPADPAEQRGPSLFPAHVVTNAQEALVRRRQAVALLAGGREGAEQLLGWYKDGLLSNDLRPMLTLELAQVPWAEVRSQAWEVLPPYLDKNQQLLPRLQALVAFHGNPERGAVLFRHPDLNCIGCHRLKGEGVAVGSDLSDIGLRLGAEDLWESLLDPSAIITPGLETWLVVDEEENEHVGVLVRETEAAVILRDAKNNEINLPKTRIRQRRQVPVSLMPAGLQQGLTLQDLVDLWSFLRSCRQPPATNAAPVAP